MTDKLPALQQRGTRLTKLYAMLKARTGPDGKPKPNYKENVEAIKAEIARFERRPASGTVADSDGDDGA